MMYQQNGPPGDVRAYQQMAQLSTADQKIAVAAVHQFCGFSNAPPDNTANFAAVVPFGVNFVFTEQVNSYLAVALSRKYTIENE